MSAARYRKPATNGASPNATNTVGEKEKAELKQAVKEQAVATSNGLSVLDILRIIGGIVLFSSGLSYLTSSGESMTWGYNPWWTRAREWKSVFQGEISLTDAELARYNGENPKLPIYLALNGTIYDVSISPQTYGPDGSYHVFAGRDAARAFLTGCFQEDSTPDMRGVEQMFMPIDPELKPDASEEVKQQALQRKKLTKGEMKNRHAQELRKARKQVKEGLESWHKLFRGDKGKAYRRVGQVKRPEGWMNKLPVRKLCEQAEKSRPVRKYDE